MGQVNKNPLLSLSLSLSLVRRRGACEMGDAFKLLSFGAQFDKKRFANDISLFEGEKTKQQNEVFQLPPPPSL
jgi:hypothetical protein